MGTEISCVFVSLSALGEGGGGTDGLCVCVSLSLCWGVGGGG